MFQASQSGPNYSEEKVWLSLFLPSGNLSPGVSLACSLPHALCVGWPNKTGVFLLRAKACFLQILLGGHLRGSKILSIWKRGASRFWKSSQQKPSDGSPRCWTWLDEHLGFERNRGNQKEVRSVYALLEEFYKGHTQVWTLAPQNHSNTVLM